VAVWFESDYFDNFSIILDRYGTVFKKYYVPFQKGNGIADAMLLTNGGGNMGVEFQGFEEKKMFRARK
jgi:hypothetical protein